MKSRTPLAIAAVVALALAGCADTPADTTNNASGGAPASTGASAGASTGASTGAGSSSSAGQNASDVPAGDTLLTFSRQGGIAGANDRLVVRPDGSYTLQTRTDTKSGKLTADELAALKAALASVDFNKMPTNNTNGGSVADGYTYKVTYGGREIVAEDGAIPAALQPVISALSGFLSK